ncbi:MAG: SMR family transporter [Anaerolineae bacterium]
MKALKIAVLILSHSILTSLANVGFKLSAASHIWRAFLFWQMAGNLAGFAGVLVFTGLLRLVPLHVAYPITQGLSVIAVQVLVARLLFREPVGMSQWVGTVLVIAGIVLIGSQQ